jgi:beta-glucanase (GH16 family)
MAATGPFMWDGVSWCPNYYSNTGCNATTSTYTTGSSAPFYPSQVITNGTSGTISLDMNQAATETGAFNTETTQLYYAPATFSEQITVPCSRGSKIDNWPAFWLVTNGSWPAGGEIDVMEGLSGRVYWHYHYLNAAGQDASVDGPGNGFNGCGTNTYEVNWTTSAITFYYNGQNVGSVTPAEIGVPIASGPMFVVNDYAASSEYGGPTVGGVSMQVADFTATP